MMKEKLLKAYKKELSKDFLDNKEFILSGLDQTGFDDWIKYRSRTMDGLGEAFVIGPGRLTIWGPFLLIAYIGNRIITYTFLPLLVLTSSYRRIHKLFGLIEKFLKTFFGFFGILEAFPKAKERSVEKGALRITRFQKFSKQFQRNGPEMVDDFYAQFKKRIYDRFENTILHGLTLVKKGLKKIENRYIEKYTTIKVLYRIRKERIPLFYQLGKDTGNYRIDIFKIGIDMPKEVIHCKILRVLRYLSTGSRAIFIVIQGILLTVEIILIPESISLNIRLKLRDWRYKIKMFFIKGI